MKKTAWALLAFFFVASHLASASVAIDVVSSVNRSTAATSISTKAFSTAGANELLLAFIATDGSTSVMTVNAISGAGLNWVLVSRSNGQRGTAEIWRAFASSTLTSATVTASLAQSVSASITVIAFIGTDPSGIDGSGAIGASSFNSGIGAPSASLVTTRNGSWVFGVGNDWDRAVARTLGPDQSLIQQYLSANGDTYWVQSQTTASLLSGTSVALNDTAPTNDRFNLAIAEVLPAQGGATAFTISGAISPSTSGSGASLTLTQNGTTVATTTADSSGNYSFTNLQNGTYTVTPTKNGFNVSPASQTVTVNGADVTDVSFTAAAQTWTLSGNVTPVLAGVSVSLTGAANGTSTTDAGGNYSFTSLSNGTYTVTPSLAGYTFSPTSQSVVVNGASASANFTDQAAGASPLSMDVQVSADLQTAATTATSPGFSTSASNELLLAFVAADYLSGTNTTVTGVTGGGLTWALVKRANTQSGTAEVWRAFAASQLTNASVSATLSQRVASTITVVSFTGADPSGTNGSGAIGATNASNATSGSPTATLTSTRAGSWVFGVGDDFDRAVARTVGASQTMVHEDLSSTGDTYWVQRQNATTPVSGSSVTINDTAPTNDRFNLAIVEVLPSPVPDTVPPTVGLISPAANATVATLQTLTAKASDNVGVASVQFQLDGSSLGSPITQAPYELVWDSTAVASGTHILSAVARDAAGNAATAPPVTITVDHSGNPAVVGSWASPIALPAVAVNLALLKNNKLLFYQDGSTPQVWDYLNNVFTNVPTSADLFCSGHADLADGRLLVLGGYGGSGSAQGIRSVEIFNPANNSWTAAPSMNYARWYPTATTLGDGRILVTAGWQTTAHTNAGIPEIYDPSTNAWTKLSNANNPFETYPFIYLLPDGRLVHVGGSEYATVTETLDINSQTWTTVDPNIVDGSSSKMYLPYKIIKAGTAADSQMTGAAANTAYTIDMSQASPTWQQIPSMAFPRSFMNLTELPDGSVLATGGETDKNGGNIANAVYAAELWDPQSQTWTTMSSMQKPREYHGTALLLPDGRVVESGMGADFGSVPDQLSAEFFSPPYLFKGARPTISQAPAQMQYGQSYTIATPDASSISKAVLIRTGAVTHFFDQNTHYVPLTFSQISGGLTVTAPANGNAAPPGYYMLFVVNGNGIPSVAPIVQLGP